MAAGGGGQGWCGALAMYVMSRYVTLCSLQVRGGGYHGKGKITFYVTLQRFTLPCARIK